MSNTKNGKYTENGLIASVVFEKWSNGEVLVKDFHLLPTYTYKTTNNGKTAYYIIPLDVSQPSWDRFGASTERLNEAYNNALIALGAVG